MREEISNQEYEQIIKSLDYLNAVKCFREMNNFIDKYQEDLYLKDRWKEKYGR